MIDKALETGNSLKGRGPGQRREEPDVKGHRTRAQRFRRFQVGRAVGAVEEVKYHGIWRGWGGATCGEATCAQGSYGSGREFRGAR